LKLKTPCKFFCIVAPLLLGFSVFWFNSWKTKDQLFEKFHTKTRYNIRLATKKGVQIKEGTREDLEPFHKIMIETGKRDGFVTRSLEYFQTM